MATEVGVAYATILPSAKGLGRQIRQEIAKEFAGSGLDEELSKLFGGKPIKIPVQPVFDPDQLPDRIPTKRPPKLPVAPEVDPKALPKTIPTKNPPKVPVEMDPLTKLFATEVKRQTTALAKQFNVAVPIGADTDELRSNLADQILDIERKLKAEIPVEAGARREFEREIAALVAGVEDSVKARLPVEVDEPEVVEEVVEAVEVAEKAAPKIKLKVDVDKSSLSQIKSVFGSLTKGAGGFSALTILPALAAQAAVGVGQFVAALAPAAGILVALPGLALAGAAALGVFKIATSGVGDALKAGLSGDAAKFEKALQGLSPAAQSAAKAVVALKPAFDKIKSSVQDQFFAGLGKDIQNLGGIYLPILQKQLPAIAAGFSLITAGITAGLADAGTSTALGTLLGSVSEGLARASTGIAPLVKGFAQLGAVAAPLVADLGGGIGSLAAQFGTFLTSAAQSGQLTTFLSNALATLKELGGIASNIGSIFSSAFSAAGASGGNLLGTLSTITGSVAAFFKTAEGSAALQAVFSALAQVGQALSGALAAVLPALGKALVELAPSIGPLASALGSVLTAAAPLLPVIGQLAGIIAQLLTTALGNLASTLGPVIGALAQTLGPILTQVSGAFKVLAPLIAQVATQFGGQLLAAFLQLAPTLTQFAQTLITALLPHLPALADVMGKIAQAVGEAAVQFGGQLADALVQLLPYLPDLIGGMLQASLMFLRVLPPVIKFGTAISQAIPAIIAIVKAVSGFGSAIGDQLRKVFDDTVSSLTRVGDFFVGIGTKIADFFTKTIPSVLSSIGTFLSGLPDKIGSFLSSLPGKLAALASQALSDMAYAVGYGIGTVVRWFIDLPGRLAAAFEAVKAAVGAGISAVVTFFTELPGKVSAEVSRLWSEAGALFTAGVTTVVALVVGLKDKVVTTFTDLWARAKSAVSAGIDAVVGFFKTLPQRSSDAVSDLPGKVLGILSGLVDKAKTIGGQVVDGLVQGIKNAAGNALQAVKDLGSNIAKGFKDALGIKSPSRVFAALGEQIPAGLAIGMDRAHALVETASSRLAQAALTAFPAAGGFAAPAFAGTGGLTVENYYESESGSATATAEELAWIMKGRG